MYAATRVHRIQQCTLSSIKSGACERSEAVRSNRPKINQKFTSMQCIDEVTVRKLKEFHRKADLLNAARRPTIIFHSQAVLGPVLFEVLQLLVVDGTAPSSAIKETGLSGFFAVKKVAAKHRDKFLILKAHLPV